MQKIKWINRENNLANAITKSKANKSFKTFINSNKVYVCIKKQVNYIEKKIELKIKAIKSL